MRLEDERVVPSQVDDLLLATGVEFDPGLASGAAPGKTRFARAPALAFKHSVRVESLARIPARLKELFAGRADDMKRVRLKLLVAPEDLPKWEASLRAYIFTEKLGYRIYALPSSWASASALD